jgi:hypothetical protein
MANYLWSEFLAAIDSLLLTDGSRFGTTTAKTIQVKAGVLKLQMCVEKYRQGHQTSFTNDGTVNSDLSANGFVGVGVLPENCEPRDGFIIKKKTKTVSNAVDAVDDELTVTAHGLTAATAADEVEIGKLTNSGGAVPAGIDDGRSYYLRVVDANTITLHTTAAGVIDNTDRVDVTADGTGTTTIDFGEILYPVTGFDWRRRMELVHRAVCFDGLTGLFAVNPNADEFWLYPLLPVGDDEDGYNWLFQLNWDGVKLDWADGDQTRFDEPAAAQVAEYVKSWFLRHVDQDLPQADVALAMSKSLKADLYLTGNRQRGFKP